MHPMKARTWIATLAALTWAPPVGHADEVDTQFIFGFTMGADVGELGEKEVELESVGGFGKRNGSYTALENQLRAEFTPAENLRLEMGVPVAYHSISGVTGLDNRQQTAFDGVSFEVRYRLLDRDHAPSGLTIGTEPHWARVDETSGEPVDNYGSEFSIAADKEFVEDRVYGALNLLYDPELTRSRVTGTWERQATLGISAAVTTQLHPGIFLGGEARYLRTYEGIGFDPFAGNALFVGPTMYITVVENMAISAAWNVQVAGHAPDSPGSFDLRNFERQQANLRLMYNF
ncbi:MAG: hypothetical protein ACLQJR_11640 [Stellaceae bacterium]